MRKIVSLATLLFCFLPLTANAQGGGGYNTVWNAGSTDITTSLPTVNAWKQLGAYPATCLPNTLRIGGDSTTLCLDSAGHVWDYSRSSASWDSQAFAALGNGLKGIALTDASHIYALQTASFCGSGYYHLNFWSGSAWVDAGPYSNSCFAAGSAVGTRDGLVCALSTLAQPWCKSGGTWTSYWGTNWTQFYPADAKAMCGIKSGSVYLYDGTSFNTMSVQPGGTPVGCLIVKAPGAVSVLTWNASGTVRLFDLLKGHTPGTAWVNVTGSTSGLVGISKAMILGLDASGHSNHLNVYPGYVGGVLSGSAGTAPTYCGNVQCPTNGATHTAKLQVKFPHGKVGTLGTASGTPYQVISASSYDYSVACDPLMGAPNDTECVPATPYDEVDCSISGGPIANPGPAPTISYSEDAKAFNGTIVSTYSVPIIGGWGGTAVCGASIDACALYTTPTCGQTNAIEVDAVAMGPGATWQMAITAAEDACDTEGQPPNAWKIYNTYETGYPASCTGVAVEPVPNGFGTIDCF